MPEKLSFRPVTPARWADFEALFSHKGAPSYCWCMAWRTTPEEAKHHAGAERKPMMKQRVMAGTPVGLVGSFGGEPVAWVSIAPRDTYRELGGPEAEASERIWSLACMYIHRNLRGQGYGMQLIEAAIAYAKSAAARCSRRTPSIPTRRATATWASCRRSKSSASRQSAAPASAATSCGSRSSHRTSGRRPR